MTRKLLSQRVEDGRSRKRILKPVVEKKRRDRINQSLAELRRLLLRCSSDARLQNPKIEKAEILDLVVEYLKKWTDRQNLNDDGSPGNPLLGAEAAGFQQCVARRSGSVHRGPSAQRAGLALRPPSEPGSSHSPSELPDVFSTHENRPEPPWMLFPPHPSCSTPCHDYLSPPPSPWFSPTFSASPPFPSLSCPFSIPPSLTPPCSNTSYLSFSPALPHTVPTPTSVLPPPLAPHREESAAEASSATWRPWM